MMMSGVMSEVMNDLIVTMRKYWEGLCWCCSGTVLLRYRRSLTINIFFPKSFQNNNFLFINKFT
jgi:hypothetical protein